MFQKPFEEAKALKINKIDVLTASFLLTALLLFGCVGQPPATPTPTPTATASPTPTKPGTLVFGGTLSLKGKYEHEGKQALWGIQAAVKWVNDHGGVKVGNKVYNLQYKYYDDESSSERVPELYSKLIEQDKVDFLIAPYSSTLTKAAAPVAESHKVVMVSHGGASDSIYEQGYKYFVGALSPASYYLRSVVEMLASMNDKDIKIALIYENSPFPASVIEGAKKAASEKNLNVVYEFRYEKGVTEFGSPISEAMAKNANVLMGGGHFADGRALASQAWSLGWKLKAIAILVAPTLPEFYTDLKDAANGVMAPAQWEIGVKYSPEAAKSAGLEWFGPTNNEFVSAAKSISGGTEPDYHAAEAAGAVLFLVKAIETAGSLDQSAVRNAFNTLKIMTFFGPQWIDPSTGKNVGHPMIVVQWQNGEKKIVWPESAATASPVYPASNWWTR